MKRSGLLKQIRARHAAEVASQINILRARALFLEQYAELSELASFSSTTQRPICLSGPQPDARSIPEGRSDPLFGIYKIVLNEVQYMPRVRTLSDALAIRGDPRIADFRSTIANWASIWHSGDLEHEARCRHEIRKANRALHTALRWERAAKWVTYLSIPISLVAPYIPLAVGISITLVGGVAQFATDVLKHENDWLMIGRGQ